MKHKAAGKVGQEPRRSVQLGSVARGQMHPKSTTFHRSRRRRSQVLKLFCSVRYEDYELYMRLLGEASTAFKTSHLKNTSHVVGLKMFKDAGAALHQEGSCWAMFAFAVKPSTIDPQILISTSGGVVNLRGAWSTMNNRFRHFLQIQRLPSHDPTKSLTAEVPCNSQSNQNTKITFQD